MTDSERESFFIQEHTGEAWHVESEFHPEIMLCGKLISVDAPMAKIQHRWGTKKCPDCWMKYEAVRSGRHGT